MNEFIKELRNCDAGQIIIDVSTAETLMRTSLNDSSTEEWNVALAVGHWMESGERSRGPMLMD